MKMKTIRSSILCLVVLLLSTPLLCAQDRSKYRPFATGMSSTRVLERTDQKMAEVKMTHQHPALMQALTWWPPNRPGTPFQSDTVQQILLSFYNGELYRISVTYDQGAIGGLTAEDMVQSISAKYGPPAISTAGINVSTNERQDSEERVIALWEDSQYSLSLHRSSFSSDFELVICSMRLNAEADEAIAKAVKLEEQADPARDAGPLKTESVE